LLVLVSSGLRFWASSLFCLKSTPNQTQLLFLEVLARPLSAAMGSSLERTKPVRDEMPELFKTQRERDAQDKVDRCERPD